MSEIDKLTRSALGLFRPPPDLTVSEWADKYRRLSAESSASPGRWRTSVVEYLREPMDMVGDPKVRRISLMTSAQVGKSSFVENVIGFFMHLDPCPILMVNPRVDDVKMFSKERFAPMVRDTPVLRSLVKTNKSRDSGNTIASKQFPGGALSLVGANAPAGLASRPIRVVCCDEVDRYERSAGTEGDPINLAIKRTTTFWNRVIVFVSTPGNKGVSRIEEEYLAGDQRQRHCACPHCGATQVLRWAQVKWEPGQPDTAMYECEHCEGKWDDEERILAVREGEWIPQKPFNGNVSYHLNQLYSPFAPLSDGVRDFLASRGNAELMKTWTNTFLGETWEEQGQRLEWSDIMDNREEWVGDMPEEVTTVTAAVDIQDDRFEIERVGWGDDYRSWSLSYDAIYGDLSTPEPWRELRSHLLETLIHPLFGEMPIRMTCIDTGGHYTTAAYDFTATLPRVAGIKGVPGFGKPMVGRPSKNNLRGIQLFPLGVDTIKELVAARLRITDPDKPGYCSFPHDRGEEYFRGITAEEIRTKYVRGFPTKEWYNIRKRNEPFDLRVYNTAALEMLRIDLNAQRRAMLRNRERHVNDVEEKPKPTKKPARRRHSWKDGWKHG